MKITSGIETLYAAKEMHNAKKIMAEANKLSEALQKPALEFDVFSEIDPKLREARDTAVNNTARLRSPEVLNTCLSMKLIEGGITPKAWQEASLAERRQMMKKMLDIMLEEMQVPKNICSQLQLQHVKLDNLGGNMSVAGRCERFVGQDEKTGKLGITATPVVQLNEGLVYQKFDTAMGCVFNQAVKVMQQTTCLEPAGTYCDSVEQAKWAAEVNGQINGRFADFSDMHAFAVNAEKAMLAQYYDTLNNKSIAGKNISFKSSTPSAT